MARSLNAFVVLLSALALAPSAAAGNTKYIWGTGADGQTRQLAVNRYPALYTGNFGDCLGGQSLFNVTRFDAAYYSDNLTVLFHLDGTSNIRNESLMLHFSVEAYGQSRFNMTFNPCHINVPCLCPLNASNPVTAYAAIPVGARQVGGIPSIAFSIPDFEGTAKMQIFANSSQTEIGCFQASMTNGNTFGHREAVAPVLGVFTFTVLAASFLAATYGVSIAHMRTHYAHSLSVLIVFETFQSIFFSGALTVEWPTVLIAWWSNFAWAAGMIHSSSMVRSVDPFAGVSGNASQVGGAGSTVIDTGGGLAATIYGRAFRPHFLRKRAADNMGFTTEFANRITKREPYNASNPYDYTWGGDPVKPGIPLPGSLTGFPATLSFLNIPSKDAFLIGFIWLLVLLGFVAVCMVGFKYLLEGLVRIKWLKEDRLAHFRNSYVRYICFALLRTLFIAFFMMMVLSLYQFSIRGSAGATAIAAIVFLIFFLGMGGLAAYACHYRFRFGKYTIEPDEITFQHTRIFKVVPFVLPLRASTIKEKALESKPAFGSISCPRIRYVDDDPARPTVHEDLNYIKKFGWLSARYRRTRWWYFMFYLCYQFVRACFVGGASGNPLAQVYGLFVFDIVALVTIIKLRPFEGGRNTAMAVWILGLSKVATTGLSIAFLPEFAVTRIIATAIGIVIIVVQGVTVIALLILVILGVVSSRWSLSRNREELYNKADYLEAIRVRYFENLEAKAADAAPPPKKAKEAAAEPEKKEPEPPKEPYFSVNNVRRAPKIEDEDEDRLEEMGVLTLPYGMYGSSNSNSSSRNNSDIFDGTSTPNHNNKGNADTAGGGGGGSNSNGRVASRASRPNSVSSRYSVGGTAAARAGRAHRVSWSSKDFAQWDAERAAMDRAESAMAHKRMSSAGRLEAVDDVPDDDGDKARAAEEGVASASPSSSSTEESAPTPPSPPQVAHTAAEEPPEPSK